MMSKGQFQIISSLTIQLLSVPKFKRKQIDEYTKQLISQFYFPLFFPSLHLSQILLNKRDLYDKFSKTFLSLSLLKPIKKEPQDFNSSESFLFMLRGKATVFRSIKKGRVGQNEKQEKGKFCMIEKLYEFKEEEKIELPYDDQSDHIIIKSNSEATIYLLDGRISQIERFRIQITKDDYELKKKFIDTYLFCGVHAVYSLKSIRISIHDSLNQFIPLHDDQIQLVHSGSVLCIVKEGKNIKYQRQLVKGAILSSEIVKGIIQQCKKKEYNEEKGFQLKFKSKKCILISLLVSQFLKVIKNSENILSVLSKRLQGFEENRQNLTRKSELAEKQNQVFYSPPIQLNVGVTIKRSKAFRIKSQVIEESFQKFMSMNKYEIMTKSKENVQKRLLLYSELDHILKERKNHKENQTERVQLKKEKEKKNLRMKKNKIQSIAIKQSIQNTERYRDKSQTIKFIFQDDVRHHPEEMRKKIKQEIKEIEIKSNGKKQCLKEWKGEISLKKVGGENGRQGKGRRSGRMGQSMLKIKN